MSDAVKWQSALRRKEILCCCSSCASFDLFENHEDRGNQFKQSVQILVVSLK
jgi:UDP-N-acetylmuramoylalanine--D-glutamate ligase